MMTKMKNRSNRQGFTLIEILVVLAIIGILAAIAIPDMGRRAPHYRLISATGAFQSDIEFAVARAIKYNRIHCMINPDGSNQRYQIVQDCNRDHECTSADPAACTDITGPYIVVDASFTDLQANHFYPDVQFSTPVTPEVHFTPMGTAMLADNVSPASLTYRLQTKIISSGVIQEHTILTLYPSGVVQALPTDFGP